MNLAKKTIQLILLIALSIFLFDYSMGLKVIDPTNIKWIMSVYHDWGQHYLGWAYFRVEPWTFPIGDIANYNYPVGTNIGYTDSIPVLAIFFKLIRSILPENFQFLGLWMFVSYMLLAFYTIKILKIYKIQFLYSLILLTFILINPVLIFRAMHPALFGHWILIGALYFYLKKPSRKNYQIQNIQLILLIIFSALVNPYLFAMVFGFSIITPIKQVYFDKIASPKSIVLFPTIIIISVTLLWYIIGFVKFEPTVNMGVGKSYGIYALNLNSLFNSFGFSNYLPSLKKVSDFQYEGYMYLGIGTMLLLFLSMIFYISSIIQKKKTINFKARYIPLIALSFLLTLFSITGTITYGNQILFEIPLPDFVYYIGNIFRASGRFFWLPYYLLFFLAFIYVIKRPISSILKFSILSILLIIQVSDVKPILKYRHLKHGDYTTPLNEKKWETIFNEFDAIYTYPPFRNHLLYKMDYQDLDYIALKARKPITNGYVARNDLIKKQQFTKVIETELLSTINPEHLFVTTKEHLEAFKYQFFNKNINIFQLDDYYIIYSKYKHLKNQVFPLESYTKYDSVYNQYSKQTVSIEKELSESRDHDLKYNYETIDLHNNLLKVSGWAFIENMDNKQIDSIYISLSSKGKTYLFSAKKKKRYDLVTHFKRNDIENMGFTLDLYSDSVKHSKFDLNFAFKTINNKWIYCKTTESINKYPIPAVTTALDSIDKTIKYNIENINIGDRHIEIKGWAFIPNQISSKKPLKLFLTHKKNIFEILTKKVLRNDVSRYYNSESNLDNSGFKIKFKQNSIPIGNYQLGISIYDLKLQNYVMVNTDKSIEINY